ncbi:MAG: hypothetical protein ACXADW_22035 [Candidatus Hodarchaeales archaeon]|jgi:hypothetical protein
MKKIKITQSDTLIGVKKGFFYPTKNELFVSPAVKVLIDADLELMKENLFCFVMPLDKSGRDVYNSLEEWINDLDKSDLFGADENE